MLQSMSRRERRESLSRRSAADRRRMIAETVRVRRRVQDSDINYSPEVCWAINAIVRSNSEEGYELLRKRYASLPAEVQAFYDAYSEDRYSTAAAEAYARLGNYRIVKDDDDAQAPEQEDTVEGASGSDKRLNSFMEGAVALESGVDKTISEARDTAASMSREAEEALESAKEQATKEAEAFAEKVSEVYSDAVDAAISAQVQHAAEESASALVEQEVAEGSDADVDDNNIASLQGDLAAEATAEEDDDTPQDVQDSVDPTAPLATEQAVGCTTVPCVQGTIGASVQIVYMGNIYSGVLAAVGDGSVMISGLPGSLFRASDVAVEIPSSESVPSGVDTDISSMSAAVTEEPLDEEAPIAEVEGAAADIELPATAEEAPVLESVVEEEVMDAEESTSPLVQQVIDRVLAGEDIIDDSGVTGILYDEDGDVVVFMTPLYTESISTDAAASWLSAHLGDFEAVTGIAEDPLPVQDDVDTVEETTVAEEVTEGSGDVVAEDVQETVTEDVEEDPLSAGVIPDVLTGDPIQWESVESASQEWASSHSLSLATNPEDANLNAALQDLSGVLSPYLVSLRVDPSVSVLYLKDKPFITLSGASANVGSVSFIYQTDASGIASFAQQFAKAVVQLAHLLVGDEQPAEVSQEVTDGELLSEEAKQEVLQSVEEEVKKTLEEAGVEVEDSSDIPTVTDKVQDSAPNNYDIPHTLSSFRKIRNTRKVLDSVLALASTIAGTKITASKYRSMQNSGGKRNRELLKTVLDTVFMTDHLDLVCDSLYRRKLGDTFWVCDDAAKVASAFKFSSDITGPCMVSSAPFDAALVGDRVVDSVPVGSHTLYFIRL